MRKKVAIIIDNPLRDLAGVVLICRQIALKGWDAFIVPMLKQVHEIEALNPDVVLVNYVRSNNSKLLEYYKSKGIAVCVLDTEGSNLTRWGARIQQLLLLQADSFVDRYYCWGEGQKKLLEDANVFDTGKVVSTGLPRYDFISTEFKGMNKNNYICEEYVLINTNFPILSPKYSSATSDEIKNWGRAGLGVDRARKFAEAQKIIQSGIIDAMHVLLKEFSDTLFVLRPHPFENPDPYVCLNEFKNFEIRQEGTSIEWLAGCKALLHLNCNTSVEASMMEIPALSFEWLNSPHVANPDAVASSIPAKNVEEITSLLGDILNGVDISVEKYNLLSGVIPNVYLPVDGKATNRLIDDMVDLEASYSKRADILPKLNRQSMLQLGRKVMGYKGEAIARRILLKGPRQPEKDSKIPTLKDVSAILDNINETLLDHSQIYASMANADDYSNVRGMTDTVIKITCAG